MTEKILKTLSDEMNDIINSNYKKSQNKTVAQRYRGLSEGYQKILKVIKKNYIREAKQYYIKRSKLDKKLEKIQTSIVRELKNCVSEAKCVAEQKIQCDIVPASSFSARTNLIGESDIDFLMLVKDNNTDKAICLANTLGQHGYKLSEIRNKHDQRVIHWVFNKYVDNVEIEVKVRDHDGFKEILKMHIYTDKKMSEEDKILATFGKALFKQFDKKAYDNFKQLYYSNAGHLMKCKDLLYPLL